jgi:hypothetical protein
LIDSKLSFYFVNYFGFLNIKSVNIYAIPPVISTTLLFYKLDTLSLKQKNLPVLEITCFFPHSYSCNGLGATHIGLHLSTHPEKRNMLYPILAATFVSIVLYRIHVIDSGPNMTLKVYDNVIKIVMWLTQDLIWRLW